MKEFTKWQLKIYEKSLKKKEKMKLLEQILPELAGKILLDLGCAKGTISYLLREKGGEWISADLDYDNLVQTIKLVEKNVVQVDTNSLPFKKEAFDGVVSLDFIEHIDDDEGCLRQIYNFLKPGGWLILSTPMTGPFFVVNKLKNLTGLKPEIYGHKLEGYKWDVLRQKLLNAGFIILYEQSYSRFFTEFIEYLINLAFIKLSSKNKSREISRRDGAITPSTEEEFNKYKKLFKLYSLIYPITYTITRLDKILFFSKGYASLILAQKP